MLPIAVYQSQMFWLTHCNREQAPSHILICGVPEENLQLYVITTLAVASLIAQFSGTVPEDSRLHVIDLVQAVHAAPVGAG
ncbi:hypothetical protein FRT59_13430 [Pseudomonas haemolytica]|uniref:Uncharacterized protein n=1 Tax=Pseudomonas haemolytica TaxID=2600065 RepID=A0A5P1DBU2_9PSED|nr:hypothetical protein [Pseudomonas haemolytica]